MKVFNKLCLVLTVFLIIGSAYTVNCQTASDETTVEDKAPIPDNTDMGLEVMNKADMLPDGFRGTEKGSGDLQWLEDKGILMAENADLYNSDASTIAEGAKFEGPPNITWDTKKVDADGEATTEKSENTNKASNTCNITTPGYYEVHNGGARLVSTCDDDQDSVGGSNNTSGSTTFSNPGASGSNSTSGSTSGNNPGASGSNSTSGSTSGNNPGASGSNSTSGSTSGTNGGAAAGQTKTVTAQQTVGIRVHDCTAPDVWVAFQECSGNVKVAESEQALKQEMADKIVKKAGEPFSTNVDDFADASYIFVDEGDKDSRDKLPREKTARLTVAGCLFNELGAPEYKHAVIKSKMDESDFRNHVNIAGGKEQALKGVFVRRNIPFIVAAVSADNSNKRIEAKNVETTIEYADGTPVEKEGDSYIFRVQNYPREEYKEQPGYVFSVVKEDPEGNVTTIRMPLYVVNTSAAYSNGESH